MRSKQSRMDVLLLLVLVLVDVVGDEIYANIQQFIDSDTCCNYQFNINYRGAVHSALREHISSLDRDEF